MCTCIVLGIVPFECVNLVICSLWRWYPVCENLFQSSRMHGESMWPLNLGTPHVPLPLPVFCQVRLVLSCWLLQIWLEMLCYRHADARHMILDCALTVHHMLQFVHWVDLEFLVIPDQIAAEPCGLEGCYSQLLYQLNSQSEKFGNLETKLSMVTECVLCLCCACNGPLL